MNKIILIALIIGIALIGFSVFSNLQKTGKVSLQREGATLSEAEKQAVSLATSNVFSSSGHDYGNFYTVLGNAKGDFSKSIALIKAAKADQLKLYNIAAHINKDNQALVEKFCAQINENYCTSYYKTDNCFSYLERWQQDCLLGGLGRFTY